MRMFFSSRGTLTLAVPCYCVSGLETERERVVCCFGDRKLLASLQDLFYFFLFFLSFVCSFGNASSHM